MFIIFRKNSPAEAKVVFAKFSDITKATYPVVTMQLQKNINIATLSKQQYKIVLEVVMPGY
ncbi:MAG: hypothetical protein GTN67_09145 [Hydrotalea flava]|uniref:hypothetical protein n=1 Tax=Hydrotalea TaxID=1004300 RepID=UPI000944487A|nr:MULTISPECIES: hypothetical protein [Hydrotalea]MBY0347712.1 hypothetical protein [Hydrotalea flava]NIM35526.1 hypothetical protein [Hydrotalea flava]NIM38383.1 hypothetical protein [Hydrotalea flava]NIN03553.1 hypothetical protein [Hydrotalea flava]NIN15240.1 hypothetical protein [Hydrotalea flava]